MVLVTFFLLFFCCCPHDNASTVKGVVVDWQYALIITTRITVTGPDGTKDISVDENGSYELALPPGAYVVTAEAPGFRKRSIKLRIESEVNKTLNIMLDVVPQKPIKCPKGALCL